MCNCPGVGVVELDEDPPTPTNQKRYRRDSIFPQQNASGSPVRYSRGRTRKPCCLARRVRLFEDAEDHHGHPLTSTHREDECTQTTIPKTERQTQTNPILESSLVSLAPNLSPADLKGVALARRRDDLSPSPKSRRNVQVNLTPEFMSTKPDFGIREEEDDEMAEMRRSRKSSVDSSSIGMDDSGIVSRRTSETSVEHEEHREEHEEQEGEEPEEVRAEQVIECPGAKDPSLECNCPPRSSA